MDQHPPIVITTSHRPSDQARMLARLLNHVIPNSHYENRGSKSEAMLYEYMIEKKAKYLLLLQSKGNKVSRILVYQVKETTIIEIQQYFKIYQFIDPKIYGWKTLPARGPLSISLEGRQIDIELVDFMEKYFSLKLGSKTELWLMLDKTNGTTYIQFLDALTMKPIAFLQAAIRVSGGSRLNDQNNISV